MTMKTTNAHKFIKVSSKSNMPPTCFSNTCGHPQGGALQRMDISRYYKSLWTNA